MIDMGEDRSQVGLGLDSIPELEILVKPFRVEGKLFH